jgi:membrane-bound lytic murein transglycosylase D
LAGCASEPADDFAANPIGTVSLVASESATTPSKLSDVSKQSAKAVDAAVDLAAAGLPFIRSQPREVPPFPLVLNAAVQRYVREYAAHSAGLRNSFERSRPYMPAMIKVFKQHRLPADLVYLSFAESRFESKGSGPWQLTRATARRFHLIVNHYIDERRDPIKSTRAAADYLALLHREAGDWHLALVAWNRGEAALDHYWSLRGVKYGRLTAHLPYDTRALMDRFMAVAIIAQQPEEYGLDPVDYARPVHFLKIKVKGGTSLRQVSRRTGISLRKLRRLNPALLHGIVPWRMRSYEVRVPVLENADASSEAGFCPSSQLLATPVCDTSASSESLSASSNPAATRVF